LEKQESIDLTLEAIPAGNNSWRERDWLYRDVHRRSHTTLDLRSESKRVKAMAKRKKLTLTPFTRFAITLFSGTLTWQSENRNEVNYDSFSACQLASNFQANFDAGKFPASLPGRLSTQFSVTEGLLLITSDFVREFGLSTDALDALMPAGPRRAKLERLVFRGRAPSLVERTKWRSIIV